MVYYPSIPQANDLIDESQPQILANFSQLNTTYGVDHYAYDSGSNNGYHNRVTTPIYSTSSHPSTSATLCMFYGMQDTANIGLLQYSRGPSDPIPTPLTTLQSPSTAITLASGAYTTIFDISGTTEVFFIVYVSSDNGTNRTNSMLLCHWDGTNFISTQLNNGSGTPLATVRKTGNNIEVGGFGASTNIYYTCQFLRIQT